MADWIFFKAYPHEMKNRRRKQQPFPTLCRICGKPMTNNNDICSSCRKFIKYKQFEERKKKK